MKKLNSNKYIVQPLYLVLRVAVLLICFAVFIPGFNPARISDRISGDVSLLTTAVSYSNLTIRFERAFSQAWVEPSVFVMLMVAACVSIAGTLSCGIGTCMSLGNYKMKIRGLWFNIIGAVVMIIGLMLISFSHHQLVSSARPERLDPIFPSFLSIYLVFGVLILIISLTTTFLEKKNHKEVLDTEKIENKIYMEEKYSLFLLLLPIIIATFLFCYLPLWGWRYAFFDYSAGGQLSSENFVGFKWFTFLFKNTASLRDLGRVMINTLIMSSLGIITSWLPLFFAIGLNEIRSKRLRQFIQTFTTIPNFISWVLIYGIAIAIFSTNGFLNSILSTTGLLNGPPVNYLMGMEGSKVYLVMLLAGIWKSIGWSAIIYIAAISSIEPQLFEAAKVDGADRFARIRYIIIPSLMPTYLVLLLLSIGGILSNGLEQYLVFQNPLNRSTIEVLDLYVYNIGINDGRIPISTVVSMAKSVISVSLLLMANKASKLIRDETII